MVAFVCVGDGSEKAALEREVKRRDLGNVYLLPSISRSAIPGFLDKMDALYIGLQNQPLFRFGVSPNKLMDYMMAAKPVIYAISSGNDMVAESGCGISIPPECPNAIADAVKTLKNLPNEQREQMGQAGKDFILAHHDYRVIAREFLLTLEPDS